MNTHILKLDVKGTGILETITPECSCGWIGIGYAAHNDYQMTNVREQEKKHLHTVSLDVLVRGENINKKHVKSLNSQFNEVLK